MTNSGFRCLMLAAVAAACTFSLASSDAHAAETGQTVSVAEEAASIQIVPGLPPASEAVGVVIAPAGAAADESDSPILVAPYEEDETGQAKAAKKPAKPSVKAKAAAKKKEASKAKPDAKKPATAPMAKETASEKARAEWQKKRSGEDGDSEASKGGQRGAEQARESAAAAKKRAMIARNAAKAAGSAGANTPGNAELIRDPGVVKESRSYREIYSSIPFSRAEYDANPAYRHQATMEIMLGQLHPIIVAPLAPPRQKSTRDITVRFLPAIRPGYRPYSMYPWH